MIPSNRELNVMGIDPSLTSTGYAFVEFKNNQFHAHEYGIIQTQSDQNLPERLAVIFNSISNLLQHHKPNQIAVEDIFYANNPKIALMMGHARGASLVAIANHKIPVAVYSAKEIKMAISGYGNASKEQVRRMVLTHIKLENSNISFDVSDAFAVAICHCHRINRNSLSVRDKGAFSNKR